MIRKLISAPIVLVALIVIIPLVVYGADRLQVKNDSSTVTFNVADDGSVYAAGKMGIGTNAPSGIFEAATTGVNALFVVKRTDGARCGFLAKANQFFIGTSTNHPVVIAANNNPKMTINTDMSLTMASGATCTAGGVWTSVSSREAKENIRSLTAEEALDTLGGLNPVRYNYKVDKADEWVGFIAEDVPDLVATKERKGMSPMDIVAVLTKVLQEQQKAVQEHQKLAQEQQKVIQEQQKAIAELSKEVTSLKNEIRLRESVALVDLE